MSFDPFELFPTTAYTFLELSAGSGGNKVVSSTDTTGIFRGRSAMSQQSTSESLTASSTLYIRPDDAFIATVGGYLGLIGQGATINGDDYRITDVEQGIDPETGELCFYNAKLKKEALWESALPLV